VARGQLVLLHGTRYALPQRLDTLAGVVRRHADGYGFVVLARIIHKKAQTSCKSLIE